MQVFKSLVLTFMLAVCPLAQADMLLAESSQGNVKSELMSGGRAPSINEKAASNRARDKYKPQKMLKVQLIHGKGSPVYKVKMLMEGGVVRTVFVDGNTGEVFQ